jgi:hypothetical protein
MIGVKYEIDKIAIHNNVRGRRGWINESVIIRKVNRSEEKGLTVLVTKSSSGLEYCPAMIVQRQNRQSDSPTLCFLNQKLMQQ